MTDPLERLRRTHLNNFSALLIFLTATALLSQGRLNAAELDAAQSDGVTVHFPSGEDELAKSAVREVNESGSRISERLGFSWSGGVEVYLASSDYEQRRLVAELGAGSVAEWAAAVAIPSKRTIIVKIKSLRAIGAGNFRQTLDHELVHVYLRKQELPLWLNEGLAEFASGRVITTEEQLLLERSASSGGLLKLAGISSHFDEDEGVARLAYIQSCEFVRFLYGTVGREAMAKTIIALDGSRPFEDIFRANTGRDADALFAEFAASLEKSHSILKDIFLSLDVFGFMALLVIVVFIITMIRRRRKRRQLEMEELED
jgi:hypothetical protein